MPWTSTTRTSPTRVSTTTIITNPTRCRTSTSTSTPTRVRSVMAVVQAIRASARGPISSGISSSCTMISQLIKWICRNTLRGEIWGAILIIVGIIWAWIRIRGWIKMQMQIWTRIIWIIIWGVITSIRIHFLCCWIIIIKTKCCQTTRNF